MDELLRVGQSYDNGINDDRFSHWRNDDAIGYVHLAFKVITLAIYDLIAGETDDIISASYFFYGDKLDSNYWLWAEILGMDTLPETVIRHRRDGYVSADEVNYFTQLCTTMKTI